MPVKTGLLARLAGTLALVGVLLAPMGEVQAGTRTNALEKSFDATFGTTPRAPRELPAPSARPFVAPATTQVSGASGFETDLAALTDASKGRIGVAAIDLSSGRTVSVLGDQPFPMASTSKVAIVATFLDMVDRGKFSLSDEFPLMIPVRSAKFSSTVAPVRAGNSFSARFLIERALIHSDNTATDALLAAVGGPAVVNRWVRATGISGFRLDRDIATLVRDDGQYNPATTVDPRDSATPLAMAQFLAGLYQGRWLSKPSRDFMLATMERCVTGKRRIRGQLPPEARIAHKTGTLANTSSDVGIIQAPDGRTLVVAIYVTGQGGHAGRDDRIAQIARTIYDGYRSDAAGSVRNAASR